MCSRLYCRWAGSRRRTRLSWRFTTRSWRTIHGSAWRTTITVHGNCTSVRWRRVTGAAICVRSTPASWRSKWAVSTFMVSEFYDDVVEFTVRYWLVKMLPTFRRNFRFQWGTSCFREEFPVSVRNFRFQWGTSSFSEKLPVSVLEDENMLRWLWSHFNGGITIWLDTYCDINSVRQHNCFYYTR